MLEETHTLEVSFVGMQTEKVSIKGRTHVNVIMHEDKQQLGDVVVTGFSVLVGSVLPLLSALWIPNN